MFWLICTIISCALLKLTFAKNDDGSLRINDFTITNFIVIVLFIGVASVQFSIGINTYPVLASDLSEIRALEKRIVDIKASKYAYEKDGEFIAGSIENYQQSTNLSKYIADLAAKEAAYNKKLKMAKVYKEVFPLYFFATGWAISGRIDELPEIGESP